LFISILFPCHAPFNAFNSLGLPSPSCPLPTPIRSPLPASTTQLQSSAPTRLHRRETIYPRRRSPGVRNLAKSPYLSRLPPLLTNRYPPLRLTARIPMSPLKQPSSATPPTATSNASLPGCILRQHTADNDHLQLEPSPHVQIGIIYRAGR
jgi:hypothetical protein